MSLMIHDLHIQNYRALADLRIDPFKRVNLVVGTNNSGKTSLLEAVCLLASGNNWKGLAGILHERGEFLSRPKESQFSRSSPSQVSWEDIEGFLVAQVFHRLGSAVQGPIKIKSRSPARHFSLSVVPDKVKEAFDWRLNLKSGIDTHEYTATLELQDGMIGALPAIKRYLPSVGDVYFITTNYMDYAGIASIWDRIVLTPAEDSVIEALRLIEPAIERISFTGGRTSHSGILVRLHGEAAPVPLDSMGDGVRRILAIIIPLVSIGPGTLLIDEIDTGLYYAALSDMWRVVIETAVKQDAQVFATTHSWDCVKAFQQALSASTHHDEGALIRLDRENQQVKATIYTADELDIAVPQGIEVR